MSIFDRSGRDVASEQHEQPEHGEQPEQQAASAAEETARIPGGARDGADELPEADPFAPSPAPEGSMVAPGELPVIESPAPEHGGRVRASRHRTWRVVLAAVLALLVVAGAVYGAGVWYFSSHFLPNTQVNGQDVSGMTEGELAVKMSGIIDGYALKVSGEDVSLRIPGENIGLSYDGITYAANAIAQVEKWQWPIELTQSHSYHTAEAVTYDSAKLEKLVEPAIEKANEGKTEPVAATVSYSSEEGKFVVTPDEPGTALDENLVLTAIDHALKKLDNSVALDESERAQPTVSSDDERLSVAAAKANGYDGRSVPLEVNGKTVFTVDAPLIAKWVKIDADFDVTLDTSAIKTWAQGEFSDRYDTVGAKRTYKLKSGKKTKKVTVSGGTYGWTVDGASLAKTVAKRLKKGSDKAVEIPMKSTAAKWNPGGADWTRYIDIDLTTQHARLIDAKGKVLWESDIVSGLPKDGRSTPTGVYTITSSMGRNQTLIGSDEDGDGEPDYKTPVSYWMPFVGNSIALHDADWRSSFGGKIYKTSGSHGCVNLPVSKAKELYSLVHVGDVVVCHK